MASGGDNITKTEWARLIRRGAGEEFGVKSNKSDDGRRGAN